ncbi:hypothetical protein [Nocardioides stalactiti]|uniref:hypothetical protein n=1 Tax=Nocardioides stalactiti TaxID=2755356 RepID=UPI0016000796|nr:hypothetical protein [Nocardioides stalactiti]
MQFNYASPEHRLYDAASRWYPGPHRDGPQQLIDAAVQCLVDGLDSPSLRLLAGASAADRADDINALLESTLDELQIPRPGELAPWKEIVAAGRTLSRAPTDTIRFDIRQADGAVGGHELLVFVNDVEMTRIGAGMGMDPFDVLIPTNRLVATTEPHQVPIARCECGEYGCGSTDVTIVREGDAVHWEWIDEAPIDHGVTFPAGQYDAEVERIEDDHSWERPEDTTARLALTQVDTKRLAALGMSVSWIAKDHANDDMMKVALLAGDADLRSSAAAYQIFLRFPRARRSPPEVASAIVSELRQPPKKWRATWHSIKPGVSSPPSVAGRSWRHERIG